MVGCSSPLLLWNLWSPPTSMSEEEEEKRRRKKKKKKKGRKKKKPLNLNPSSATTTPHLYISRWPGRWSFKEGARQQNARRPGIKAII